MFLDEKLYKAAEEFYIGDAKDFQTLVNVLYSTCEDHFKPEIHLSASYREIGIIMDRVFRAWDIFIARLDKENWPFVDVLKTYPYKKAFMSNEKLKEIYDKSKQ